MRCPRCGREAAHPENRRTAFCAGCGTPLALADEPAPRAIDAPLPIDRRVARRETPPPIPGDVSPEPALGEVSALDRSSWNIGAAISAAKAEPALTPAPARAPAPAPAPARAPARVATVRTAPAAVASLLAAPLDLGLDADLHAGLEMELDAGVDVAAQGGVREVHVRRASAGRRALAWAVDVIPFVVGGVQLTRAFLREAVASLPAPPTGIDGLLDLVAREGSIVLSVAVLLVLLFTVYAALAHALAGATLGKLVARVRVVGPGGVRPTIARSAARSALAVLSLALLGAGVLLALFTRSGRALHDVLAGTWVVEPP